MRGSYWKVFPQSHSLFFFFYYFFEKKHIIDCPHNPVDVSTRCRERDHNYTGNIKIARKSTPHSMHIVPKNLEPLPSFVLKSGTGHTLVQMTLPSSIMLFPFPLPPSRLVIAP